VVLDLAAGILGVAFALAYLRVTRVRRVRRAALERG
jgi:hypothetical protein